MAVVGRWGLLNCIALSLSAGFLAWRVLDSMTSVAQILGRPMFDWEFYRQAVSRWLEGQPIYPGGQISTLTSAAGASYAYPPASVPLLLPFASDPIGRWLWLAVLTFTLLSGLLAVIRIGWPSSWVRPYCVVLLGLGLFPPALEGLAVANVNVATAGALGWAWAAPRLAVPLAAGLGVLKVFPIALAAPHGFRALVKSLGIALLICVVTLPMVGLQAWSDYASALSNVKPLCDLTRANPSMACALLPHVGLASATVVSLALAAVALLVAVMAGSSLLGVTAAAAAIMLPAAELHAHYYTLLFVLAAIGVTRLRDRREDSRGHWARVSSRAESSSAADY
jgi:hypothetical protein